MNGARIARYFSTPVAFSIIVSSESSVADNLIHEKMTPENLLSDIKRKVHGIRQHGVKTNPT